MSVKPPIDLELDVRLVPISSAQVRTLESLERAFLGLASDFGREYGGQRDDAVAGGLYLLWSTLDVIASLWKETAEDAATVEGWRAALEQISRHAGSDDEVQAIARKALAR